MAGPRLQNRKVWIFVAGAVLCDFRVVFAWQGYDFRIVRLDFCGRCSTL